MKSAFSTALPNTLEPTEGESAQIINYVNAIPGSGKTYTFDHLIALPHVKNKHNSLLVYAAPTDRLLDERMHSLIELGIDPRRIVRISSKHTINGVVQDFKDAVLGRKATKTDKGKKAEPNGNIVLCTHECIARLPENRTGRNRVTLVYDEARACLQDTYALNLPENVYDYLTTPRDHDIAGEKVRVRMIARRAVYEKSVDDEEESVFIWKWSNYGIPLPTVEELAAMLPKNSKQKERAQNILDFLTNIHSSSLDVYVSIERKKATSEYVVSNVFSPSRMFRGFAKVLILSAFFESSQMYHFLSRSNQIDPEAVELQDLTKSLLDRKRIAKLLRRMRRVRLSYVYDLGNRTLTKTEMQQAIVVASKLDKETMQKVNIAWHKIYQKKPEAYRTVYQSMSEERARFVSDDAREPAFKLLRHLNQKFGLRGSVIRDMVSASIKLQQAFMKRVGLPPEPLLVGINPRFNSYREGEGKIWEAENLDQFNIPGYKVFEYQGIDRLTQLPIAAHGLNRYKHMHSCAFLASMKYNLREQAFLKRAVSKYDPAVDRTLDYALQLLWRCNVRVASKDPVLLIVTDRLMADLLQERFRALAKEWLGDSVDSDDILRIVSPEVLIPGYTMPTLLRYNLDSSESVKRRNERRKTSVKGLEDSALRKAFINCDNGKAYSRLTMNISYNRKIGKPVDDLVAARAKLQTFAQWKKSPEGIAAYDALSTPRFNKTEAAGDALLRLDASKLGSRNEVLKIVSVIKRECPELKPQLKAWYPGDNFDHNWKTAQDYGKRYNLGWLFAQATKYPK